MRTTLAAVTIAALLATGSLVAAAEEPPAPAATRVGDETCAACHQDRSDSLAKTPHGAALADAARPEAQRGCEACHGPGSAHAEAGGGADVGGLESFKATRGAAERSAPCLRCHGGASDLHAFKSGAHAMIACTDCHGAHGARAEPLLQAAPPKLCYGCHADVKAQFALPERHDVDRGVVRCIDCHTPHGGRDRAALRGANDRPCLTCHAEVQGPFVFEHAGSVTEGCAACHEPHGSTNRHLLIRQQVAQLCTECHAVTPANHVQPRYRDCTRCHADIHGSNVDPRFLEP